jgi:hypothetical protein
VIFHSYVSLSEGICQFWNHFVHFQIGACWFLGQECSWIPVAVHSRSKTAD